MSDTVLLVTPVWNDASRLANFAPSLAKALAECELPVHWVIADDGSSAEEVAKLDALCNEHRGTFPHIHIHRAEHRGKGHVIRSAWNADEESDWLAFADCDGATSAEDILLLIRKAVEESKSVIGVRKRTESTQITESAYRWIFHHGYLWVVRLLLGLRSEDLQCGAKVFRAEDYRAVSASLEEDGFCFDTELLTALKNRGFGWLEIPINWVEKKGGKVFPLTDSWRMFMGVLRIRRRQG
ncbi:MAG: glycosyltransferase [Akkermansiaceae bacterium]|nr:glycosyltransferase [Akkermansiaceae bacterium]